MAVESGVPVVAPLCLTEPRRWPQESALAWLEKQFTKRPHAAFTQKAANITLLAAADPRTEVMAAAREIQRLCRQEHYRYRDITVLARDLSLYEDVLRQVFSSFHIPIYLDEAHPLRLHPLVELVRSLLTIAAENWPAEAVWRYLKSGFLAVEKTDIDRLENYCLAAGINYGRWQEEKDWHYIPRHWKMKGTEEDWQLALTEVNQIRRKATQALYETIPYLKKAASAGEMIVAIRKHTALLRVEETLRLWRQEAADSGDLTGASIHGQVYEAVNHLLAQAELLLAEEALTPEELLSLLDAGFQVLEISHIPLEMDMVFAADIEHSRNPAVKAAFVLGANEGLLPKKMEEGGLLSAQERVLLEKSGLEIAPSAYRRQLQEEYLLYIILTRSAERLAVSYTLADTGGKATFPSLFLGRLKELFPALQEHYEPAEPNGSEDPSILFPGLGNLSVLPGRLLASQKGEQIPAFWWDVYDHYLKENEAGISQILKGLAYRKPQQTVAPQTVVYLYGKQIKGAFPVWKNSANVLCSILQVTA